MEQPSGAQAESGGADDGPEPSGDSPTTRLAKATPQEKEKPPDKPPEPPQEQPAAKPPDAPQATPQGKTNISASVVQKIAGVAAREVSGVHRIGGGGSRAFGGIRERIPGGGTASTAGVQVEVGEKQAAIDLDVVVEYGSSISDVARAVRRNVINGVEQMTGLEVIEVNVSVTDIHLPSEDSGATGRQSSRVQ